MNAIDFRPLVGTLFDLGESPVYDDRRDALWFCNIVGRSLHRICLQTAQLTSWDFASEVCSLGLAETGRLVIALRDQVGMFDTDTGNFEVIASIEADRPETRLNDGKVGPDGAFWVGTMDDGPDRKPIGSLYRVTAGGTLERKVEGLAVSNGLAFSPDGSAMFHADTRGPWIDRWCFDKETGTISDRKRIATPDDTIGRPDGGATDSEGCYWSAGVSAGRLNRFTPTGKLVESYSLPVACPTMPCFGGKGLGTLFVTSLRHGRSRELLEKYPLTGSVLVGKSPVAGAPVTRFRDI